MALPVIPLAVGAGLLALLAFTGGKKKTSTPSGTPAGAAPVPPTPAPPPTPGAPAMPPALKAQFDDLLANGLNADGLEQVAGELTKFGFLNEAATLRARAAQLRAAAAAQAASQAAQAQSQPPPFVPGVLDALPIPIPRTAPAPAQSIPIPAIPGLTPAGLSIPIPVIPPPPPAPVAPSVQRAKVTTNDPAPSGDLIMRTGPSDSAAQVPGGGADKDGIVIILNANASPDGVWSEISWPGGRRPAARGFAKKKFLVNLPPSPTTSGVVIGAAGPRYAKCVAPSGCRLRVAPNTSATFRAMVANGETVQVLSHARGQKADHGSPGPGGWAHIKYKHLQGWVPSEWLSAA